MLKDGGRASGDNGASNNHHELAMDGSGSGMIVETRVVVGVTVVTTVVAPSKMVMVSGGGEVREGGLDSTDGGCRGGGPA